MIILNVYRYDIKGSVNNKYSSFYWLVFSLFLIAGLRYHIGIDTMRYELSFVNTSPLFSLRLSDIDFEELSQPLWFFINSFFRSFTDDFVIIQIFHSAVFHVLLARFILRTSVKPFVVLGIVYCVVWWNFSFEIMRESLCVVIYANALLSLNSRKYKSYIFSALLCIGIHWFSFVIFIITPFVYYCSRKLLVAIVAISGILILALDSTEIASSIYALTMFSDGESSERIVSYLESDTNGIVSLSFWGIAFIILSQVVYPVLVSKQMTKDNELLFFSKVLLLYVIFVLLRINILIFDRFCNYLVLLLIIYTVNIISERTSRLNNFYKVYLYIGITILTFQGINTFIKPSPLEYRSEISYDCRYIPYKSVFQDPDVNRENLYRSYNL